MCVPEIFDGLSTIAQNNSSSSTLDFPPPITSISSANLLVFSDEAFVDVKWKRIVVAMRADVGNSASKMISHTTTFQGNPAAHITTRLRP
jgi:hypothetical protein